MDPIPPASFPLQHALRRRLPRPHRQRCHKSVFLYDPLLVAAVLLLVFASGATAARRLALLCGGLAGFNILFFATYSAGRRIVLGEPLPRRCRSDMVAMLAVPLLLQSRSELPAFARRAAMALAAVALAVQLCSVFFWYNLEVAQSGSEAAPAHILRRPANIARWIGGERSMPGDGAPLRKLRHSKPRRFLPPISLEAAPPAGSRPCGASRSFAAATTVLASRRPPIRSRRTAPLASVPGHDAPGQTATEGGIPRRAFLSDAAVGYAPSSSACHASRESGRASTSSPGPCR